MENYDAATYGDHIAEIYDGWYPALEKEAVVDRIAGLAGKGPVLDTAVPGPYGYRS